LENLVELFGSWDRLDENNDLVKVQSIEQRDQFSVLFLFCKSHKILLKSVQSKLGSIINVNFEGLKNKSEHVPKRGFQKMNVNEKTKILA
jgi:hypothetical protein